MDSKPESCRLCGHGGMTFVAKDRRRPFYLCDSCRLISVPERFWLSADGERARYDLHNNANSNDGYVKYLSQVADVVTSISHPNSRILDFGCGKNAVLCRLLGKIGINSYAYDPLYGLPLPDIDNYHVIILCEVIEHIRNITGELGLIRKLLRDDGDIVIRTQIYGDPSVFPQWWYAQDPTHINFFNAASLQKLAGMAGKMVNITEYPDIFIIR